MRAVRAQPLKHIKKIKCKILKCQISHVLPPVLTQDILSVLLLYIRPSKHHTLQLRFTDVLHPSKQHTFKHLILSIIQHQPSLINEAKSNKVMFSHLYTNNYSFH